MNGDEYTPSNFPERFEANGITVEYADLKEIQMGSPLIGRLSVNGVLLSGHFGGPPLLSRAGVYVPRFLAGERKFELCRITPATREITPLLSSQHVIGLVKIEDGTLYFYRDIYRESFSELDLITGKAVLAEIPQRSRSFSWRMLGENFWGCLTVPFVILYVIFHAIIAIPYIIYRVIMDGIKGKEN
jgi:hypothetical protein